MIAITDIKNGYGNSMALILLCCRIHFKTAETSDLNEFIDCNEVDWSSFVKNCRIHRIRPLVYRIILKATLPIEFRNKITNELNKLTLQSFEQAKETERLILLLQQNNITVIPYKGTAFSKQFFGNISMRESSDIDLIINPEDIPQTIHILENVGYIAPQKNYYNWMGHEQFIKTHKDLNFDLIKDAKRIQHVEMHFNTINKSIHLPNHRNTFKTDTLYKNKLFQKEISTLHPVEQYRSIVLHHLLMDGMGYLKTVVDLAQITVYLEIINKDEKIDADSQNILNELNTNYNLVLVQNILSQIIGIPLNETIECGTEKSLTKRILSSSYRKVRKNKYPFLDGIVFNYIQLKYKSQFYNRKRDKTIYLVKSVLSLSDPQPDDYMSIKLYKSLYFLYYIIRPFRLIFTPSNPYKQV